MPHTQSVQPTQPAVQPAQPLPVQVQAAGTAADQILQGQPGGEAPPGSGQPQPVGENWEHKYAVLKGKYNAEIPQLQQTNSYLTTELMNTKSLLRDLQQQLNGLQALPPQQAPTQEVDIRKFLTPEQKAKLLDEDGISDDTLNMLGQAFMGASNQQLNTQATTFQQEIQGLRGDQVKTSRENFWTTFESAVPDYHTLNANPAFVAFMNLPVIGTGMTKQQLSEQAVQNLDVRSAIEIYNEFKRSQPPPVQQPGVQPQHGPQPQPGQPGYQPELPPVPGLAGQADPMATLNVPGQYQAPVVDTKIYSKAEVNKFYADMSIGKYNHLPDKGASLENQIMTACQEGRVAGSLRPTI